MSNANDAPDAPQAGDPNPAESTAPDGDAEGAQVDTEADTFPRDYVVKLRQESAGYRDRAKLAETRADELAQALFTARVAATGKLADATDLEFAPTLLDDTEGLSAAIDALISAKPHLKARNVSGSVGQGERGGKTAAPTFASLLQSH
ncbi:hypothetical protein BOH72_26295 [Mycobacterium sp. WY10]|nr:hypothetical protein BOH72_26295 [Mycobacterium sp. WY10]